MLESRMVSAAVTVAMAPPLVVERQSVNAVPVTTTVELSERGTMGCVRKGSPGKGAQATQGM